MTKKKSDKKPAFSMKVLGRVVKYMLHYYKIPFILVVTCILISAVTTVIGATFPQTLVDDYITPMLESGSRDFSGLASDLLRLGVIMGIGVIAAYAYNRIMVNVSQGTMRHLRDDLFHNMESLPIKYFDTHAHGDIMSVYTNDIDTLRQMLSQSIPQIINSVITMAATLVTMLVLNPAPDPDLPGHRLCDAAGDRQLFQIVCQVLCPSANGSGGGRRLHRGDAGRPEGW